MYTVYKITNKTTGRAYVGFTCQSLSERYSKHCTGSNKTDLGVDLRNSNYVFEKEILSTHSDLLTAMIQELLEIQKHNTLVPAGYNALYTEYAKNKTRAKLTGALRPEEVKKAIAETLTGLKQSPESIQKRIDQFYKPIKDQHGTVYSSINAASKLLNIPAPSISHILVGRVKKPRHGYKFTYINEVA